MFTWILSSVIVAISLLLLSVFNGRKEELRENIVCPDNTLAETLTEALTKPEERLQYLNQKINSKTARLKISQEKIDETRKTISKLEVTSGQVQLKYNELIRQLKMELTKTESECQSLYVKIEEIARKRDKLKAELLEKRMQMPQSMYSSEVSLTPTMEDRELLDKLENQYFHFSNI